MQKKSLLLALALGFSAPLWAQDVNIKTVAFCKNIGIRPVCNMDQLGYFFMLYIRIDID